MTDNHIADGVKHGFDALSIATLLGTLTEMLPHAAAILTIVWTLIRIWETETVRTIFGRSTRKEDQ